MRPEAVEQGDLMNQTETLMDARASGSAREGAPDRPPTRVGRWRRQGDGALAGLTQVLIDALDYGVVLLDGEGRVLACNRAWTQLVGQGRWWRVDASGHLIGREAEDQVRLQHALSLARKGRRWAWQLGATGQGPAVSVRGLGADDERPHGVCLLTTARRGPCEPLTLELYARLCGLTLAEQRVMARLTHGLEPSEIAAELGVAISTVRTHVAAVLGKCDVSSIGELSRRVARLPPVTTVALGGAADATP